MSRFQNIYADMSSDELIRHYAYLTKEFVRRAIQLDKRDAFSRAVILKGGWKPTDIKTKNTRGRLNAEKALRIYKSRLPHIELARRFKVHHTTISNIKHGVCWSHVTGHPKYVRGEKK